MNIKTLRPKYLGQWVRLRQQLWPQMNAEQHLNEGLDILASAQHISFVLLNDETAVIAFADAAMRHDYVNGCQTSPVVFIEGLYVEPQWHVKKCAKKLIRAIEQWGKAQGCTEIASDAALDNVSSHKMHQQLGFKITEKVVFFQKNIE